MEEITKLIPGKLDLIQDSRFFKFGNDSVFLADFTVVKQGETVVDFGSGSGVIPLLLAFKQNPGKVIGLEYQAELVEMSRRSIIINQLEEQIEIIHGDISRAGEYIKANTIDLLVSNPPYMPVEGGRISKGREKAIARHEIYCTLEDVIREGAKLLRFAGRMTMVHRVMRLAEIISLMKEYQIEPKRMRMIQSGVDSSPRVFLIEGRKGGKQGMRVEPPLIVYSRDGREYSPEVKGIYGGGAYG
ncbi:MAG: tRNA1(Val) (adenine(37)-N6)-methyltransferase [Firmicutes bacterium]|nr:tRNA1(Val) (adenine(37)-N6)-methyltransferase [Bacillota bacterium]